MKYSVITFGCRVNQADSLGFEEELLATGAEAVSPDRADLVVVNTCSVTATADQGARQTIRRIARDNPAARIVVTGCYATRRPNELAALPNVARVIDNDNKPTLIPLTLHCLAEIAYCFGKLLRIPLIVLRAHHPICHEIQACGKRPEVTTHDLGACTHVPIGQARLYFLEMVHTHL